MDRITDPEVRGREDLGANTDPDDQGDPEQELEALARLDPEAITSIHGRYFSIVYRFARYRLSDDVLAEDVTAETFTRLLEYTHRGRGPRTNVRGWLMRTAANLVNDYYRAAYNRPTVELPEALPSEGPGPAGQFESSEENRRLHEALGTLTDEQANVLALRFGSGFSLAETADAMGKNANAIKALQFRAIGALRRELGHV
jgi:RNA polymerase sigma-70 factor (ECF subfamily)